MPTVKELRALIQKSKKKTKNCAAISKMNKAELIEHARDLNLIETPKKVIEKSKFEKSLDSISKSVDKLNPKSESGKKKKASIIRRLKRLRKMDKMESAKEEAFIKRLNKNLSELFELP